MMDTEKCYVNRVSQLSANAYARWWNTPDEMGQLWYVRVLEDTDSATDSEVKVECADGWLNWVPANCLKPCDAEDAVRAQAAFIDKAREACVILECARADIEVELEDAYARLAKLESEALS